MRAREPGEFTPAYPIADVRVVVAAEAFPGILGISEVTSALVRGVRKARPEAAFNVRPLTAGGEGTIHAFLCATGGSVVDVVGGGTAKTTAPVAYLPGGIAVVEAAACRREEKSPGRASTAPVGEAIVRASALREGITSIFVATGDSGALDGGSGAGRAAGYRFLDKRGRELPSGGLALRRLARIDGDHIRPQVTVPVVAACDTDGPLTGPLGAARSYAGEGLSETEIEELEEGLGMLADRMAADLGRAVAGIPGGASGGGLAAGLAGLFSAETVPGFELLAGRTGLANTIEGADLVLVALPRLGDEATRAGPAVEVVSLAKEKGVRCFAVAGAVSLDQTTLRRRGFHGVIGAFGPFGEPTPSPEPAEELARATAKLLVRSQEPIHRRRRRFSSLRGFP